MINKNRLIHTLILLFAIVLCFAACSSGVPRNKTPVEDSAPSQETAEDPAVPEEETETLFIRINQDRIDTEDEEMIRRFEEIYEELSFLTESDETVLVMPHNLLEQMETYQFTYGEKYLYATYSEGEWSRQYNGVELADRENVLTMTFGFDYTKVTDGYPTLVIIGNGTELREKMDAFLKETEELLSSAIHPE
ncbi:MAG: hypothetical protein IIZ47_02765 [Erysipelotrichaceae bacterium]|nr:hypothetical protein [Erysipelotrichaceae bacterium]